MDHPGNLFSTFKLLKRHKSIEMSIFYIFSPVTVSTKPPFLVLPLDLNFIVRFELFEVRFFFFPGLVPQSQTYICRFVSTKVIYQSCFFIISPSYNFSLLQCKDNPLTYNHYWTECPCKL